MLSGKQIFAIVTVVTALTILLFDLITDRVHPHGHVTALQPFQVDASSGWSGTNASETIGETIGVTIGETIGETTGETIGEESDSNPEVPTLHQQCLPSPYVYCVEDHPQLGLQAQTELLKFQVTSSKESILGSTTMISKNSAVPSDANSSTSDDVIRTLDTSSNCTGSRFCGNATRKAHGALGRLWNKITSGAPIVINLINTPGWLRDTLNVVRTSSKHCEFREGAVTETTDVVLAMGAHLLSRNKPRHRWAGQIYVMYGIEAPVHYKGILASDTSSWRRSFNMTATYLTTSDVFWPYGKLRFEPIPPTKRPNYTDIARRRNKMAVWLVSHCHTHSKREKYVRAMQKHISVDIYGRCGMTPKCSLGNGTGCSTAAILSEYKFYIAFENSFCADYVSEKFFKTYTGDNHVIPVVRGGARYDELLPNDTFVNADRFTSPKELALYLKTLAADPVSHGRVLERKDQYRVMPSANVFRDVCEAVASVNFEPKTYDIKQWMGEQCDTDPRTDV